MSTPVEKVQPSTLMLMQAATSTRVADRLLVVAYGLALIVADVLMLGTALRIAYWIRFDLKLTLSPDIVPSYAYYTQLAVVIVLGCNLMFLLAGLYNWHNLVGGTSEYSRACNAISVAMLVMIVATFIFPEFFVSRIWVLFSWPMGMALVVAARFGLRRIVYALRKRGFFLMRTAVVGVNGESAALALELQHPRSGYKVVGFVGSSVDSEIPLPHEGYRPLPLLGSLDDLEAVVRRLELKEIIASSSALSREELFDLYERVHDIDGLELRLSTGLFELLTTGVQVRTAGLVPLIGLRKMRLEPSELFIKTAMDYVLTTIGVILLAPVFLYLALRVRLDSPGPVIHRRRVLGVGGKEFDAFKFRSMYVDGDRILAENPGLAEQLEREEKLKDDPRITSVGRWMRKYSLDELPQLFNVLLGQMSLVGPRMISPREAEKYGLNRYNLFAVKPGITGMWQVSGRSDLSYQERVRSDMWYVRNYTLWLDFHLLFIKTANAVLKGRGAY